jgi:putative FmdB family regulatory protein
MPRYNYKCTQCGKATLVERPVDQRNNCPTCPHCCSPTRREISGSVGFKLKGAGFHVNDYKKR